MNKSDVEVYKDIQKNAEMAMKAIDTMQSKVYDDELSALLSKQNMKYGEIRNKALHKIITSKTEPYHSTVWSDIALKSGIQMNTMLNTSTSHVAELLNRGNSRGMAYMWKSLNLHARYASEAVEFADELIQIEEINIKALKEYL